MHLILVTPHQEPVTVEMESSIIEFSEAVDGLCAFFELPHEEACLIINADMNYSGLEGNRKLDDDSIVQGIFLIAGYKNQRICSLDEDQRQNYLSRFEQIEYYHSYALNAAPKTKYKRLHFYQSGQHYKAYKEYSEDPFSKTAEPWC